MIVAEVQADSLRRCTVLVKQFKALTLVQFKGENVRDYAKTADNLLLQLERDDQLPSTHLLDIVDQLSACTVMDFKIHWMSRRTAVEEFVRETLGKDKAALSLMPNKIHLHVVISLFNSWKCDQARCQLTITLKMFDTCCLYNARPSVHLSTLTKRKEGRR